MDPNHDPSLLASYSCMDNTKPPIAGADWVSANSCTVAVLAGFLDVLIGHQRRPQVKRQVAGWGSEKPSSLELKDAPSIEHAEQHNK